MSDDTEFRQIARRVFGECASDEGRVTDAWIETDADRRTTAAELRRVRDVGALGEAEWDVESGWERFVATDAPADVPVADVRPAAKAAFPAWQPRRRSRLWWSVGIAAAIVLVSSAVLFLRQSPDRRPFAVRAAVLRDATTARGERAILRLSDGTRVVLGVESRLRYARAFGAGPREVFLDGEAYFEVAHDSTRPFVIHSGRARTQVLGTKFSVRAYADEPAVQVVVAEGRVAIGAETDSARTGAILTRGMLGRVTRTGETTLQQNVDVDTYLGWTVGRLAFHDTPLIEVARQLARWYDLDVEVPDASIRSLPLTTAFADETVDDVLQVIGTSLDVRYQRTGRTVRFLPKRLDAPRR